MSNVLLAITTADRHMDNGRALVRRGFEAAGWMAACHAASPPGMDCVDVAEIISWAQPRIVVAYPRYEWDSREWNGGRPHPTEPVLPEYRFHGFEALLAREDITRVAILHDARSVMEEQRRWLADFQPHLVLGWYHERAVLPFWPEVAPEQYERTYHSIDAERVPRFTAERRRVCLISGAENHHVYPLRTMAMAAARAGRLGPEVDAMPHPSYAHSGTSSDAYLQTMARYKVAVCTASAYQFALRKLFEATAAGCKVITDLANWDALPEIDGNLVRVAPDLTEHDLGEVIHHAAAHWDVDEQRHYAERACARYDYRVECARVAAALEQRATERAA